MSTKAWNRYGQYGGRRTNHLEVRQRFLIVCEGAKTEPNYFEGFRVPKDIVVDIQPGAGVHISVVREAITRRDDAADDYDQVWCVFDRDKDGANPSDAQNFNEALRLATANNIKVAYTNDAFELWYLLHFNYHDTAMHRHDYISKLNDLVDGGYQKNDPSVYEKLEGKMGIATRNAKKLLSQYSPSAPEHDDPSTTVHLLVEQLRLYL
jgi:hypothetical protein